MECDESTTCYTKLLLRINMTQLRNATINGHPFTIDSVCILYLNINIIFITIFNYPVILNNI